MKRHTLTVGIVGILLLLQPISAQTWTSSKRLTWTSDDSYYPAITVDSCNHIHVAWDDETPGNREIYYKKSTDGGTTWTMKRLTWTPTDSRIPDLAVDSNDHIHLVWDDAAPGNSEIYYKKSTDRGANWTTKRLTWNSGSSAIPAITVDSNDHIHVVWEDKTPGDYEIYHKKSTDGGASWIAKRLTWNSGGSFFPAIALDSNDYIHVVWHDDTSGNKEIYYTKSTNGGTSWTTNRLTYNTGESAYPNIAITSNDHIHVVWHDETPGSKEIYYKKSTNAGATWTTKRLTYNFGSSEFPSIAVGLNDYIHLIWDDINPGNKEIYYKRSTNGGITWATKRLTWTSGNSWLTAIAVGSNDQIHVIWQDSAPGNYEIYYKKGIQ